MILTGSRIFSQKGVIAERKRAWRGRIDAEIASLLRHEPLDDDQLRLRLIDRYRLDPIRLGEVGGPSDGFQPAAEYRGFQQFVAFTRQVQYTGSSILWKQMPYRGHATPIRLKLSVTDEAFITGYCAADDQDKIDRWISWARADLQTSLFHMQPLIHSHNADLTVAVTHYVATHKAHIEQQRQELHMR